MRKLILFVAAMASLAPSMPASAQPLPAIDHTRTMELVRSCRHFVKENVPDGAEFPNPYDELPTISAKPKAKTYTWQDRVKIRTPLYVLNKEFVCAFNPATGKINIKWK